MLMFEISITMPSGSFLNCESSEIISIEKKPPKVCRLIQFAKETNSEFKVNILEMTPKGKTVKVLPLLSSKTYRELGVI